MGTTLYFRNQGWTGGNEYGLWSAGTVLPDLDGANTAFTFPWRWYTSRGSAATTRTRTTSVGPSAGQEIAAADHYVSAPMDADVTIAGSITINLRMAESATTVNAGAQLVLERIDNTGTVQEIFLNTQLGTEMGITEAAQNWSAVPTSTLIHRGDRIRCRIAANDAGGTLAAGTVTLWRDGPTAAASGDSYVTFTETLPLVSELPVAGTTVYLTDVAGQVDPNGATYDSKEAWTSRGSGVVSAVRASAGGYTVPLQWTTIGGGNFIEWYTRPLQAFTLGGQVGINYWGVESNAAASVAPRFEIAICANDGTSAVVWAANTTSAELPTTEAAVVSAVAGDDVDVTTGQRLRFRMYVDDIPSTPMAAGHTATITYGATASGSGNTFLTFTQALVEASASTIAIAQVTESDSVLALDTNTEVVDIGQIVESNASLALVVVGNITGLVAVPISSTAVALSWDGFAGATAYDVERDGVVIAEFVGDIGSNPGPAISEYDDTGLTPDTIYSYRVRAIT